MIQRVNIDVSRKCSTETAQACSTRYENKCEPVAEKKCTTNTVAECEVVNERKCEVVQDEVCEDVTTKECRVVNERQCSNVPKQECRVGSKVLLFSPEISIISCLERGPPAVHHELPQGVRDCVRGGVPGRHPARL